jgi:hypothetical protein
VTQRDVLEGLDSVLRSPFLLARNRQALMAARTAVMRATDSDFAMYGAVGTCKCGHVYAEHRLDVHAYREPCTACGCSNYEE